MYIVYGDIGVKGHHVATSAVHFCDGVDWVYQKHPQLGVLISQYLSTVFIHTVNLQNFIHDILTVHRFFIFKFWSRKCIVVPLFCIFSCF